MMTLSRCAGCDQPILDRFIFNVLDQAWHAKCVKCADCKMNLSEKCFSRDGKLYCRDDFTRRYGTKCAGCARVILSNELVRRAKNKVFHIKCFTCMMCQKQLSTGEELYVLDENKFICKKDFINHRATPVSLNSPEDHADLSDGEGSEPGSVINPGPIDSDGGGSGLHDGLGNGQMNAAPIEKDSSIDGDSNHSGHDNRDNNTPDENTVGGKRRGPRTTIKAKQLETLKAAFAATPKPTRHTREQLASSTGLNMRVIQVWFQNRRSKERRMKQATSMGSRRAFYNRTQRRMRALRPGMSPDGTCGMEDSDMPHHGSGPFGYFPDGANQGDMYGSQPFYDFFPGHQHAIGHPGHHPGGHPDNMQFSHSHLAQTSIEQPVPPGGPLAPGNLGMNQNDGQFLPPEMMVGQRNSSPDSVMPQVTDGNFNGGGATNGHTPRSASSSVENFASPPTLNIQTSMSEAVW